MKASLQRIGIAAFVAGCLAMAFWPMTPPDAEPEAGVPGSGRDRPAVGAAASSRVRQSEDSAWLKSVEDNRTPYGEGESAANYQLVTPGGKADPELLWQKGLSAEKAQQAAQAIDAARSTMEALFLSHLVANPNDDGAEGSKAYLFPGDLKAEGEGILSELKTKLSSICGREKGEEFFRALRLDSQFGCYGRQEVRVRIRPASGSGQDDEVSIDCYDPASKSRYHGGTLRGAEETALFLGDGFDVESRR